MFLTSQRMPSRYGAIATSCNSQTKKEPAVADSYIKQCDLQAYFDEKRLDEIF